MQSDLVTVERPMARKKMGRPVTSDRDDVTVKLDRHVAKKLRYVAEDRDIPLAELLTELLRPIADREFEKATKGK
jgi:hypothetical protein